MKWLAAVRSYIDYWCIVQVYEYVMEDGKCVRCEDIEKLREFVKDNQQYAMIEQHLSK